VSELFYVNGLKTNLDFRGHLHGNGLSQRLRFGLQHETLERPVLVGPGSPHGDNVPQGVIATRGTIPAKMTAICHSFLDMPDHYE